MRKIVFEMDDGEIGFLFGLALGGMTKHPDPETRALCRRLAERIANHPAYEELPLREMIAVAAIPGSQGDQALKDKIREERDAAEAVLARLLARGSN